MEKAEYIEIQSLLFTLDFGCKRGKPAWKGQCEKGGQWVGVSKTRRAKFFRCMRNLYCSRFMQHYQGLERMDMKEVKWPHTHMRHCGLILIWADIPQRQRKKVVLYHTWPHGRTCWNDISFFPALAQHTEIMQFQQRCSTPSLVVIT